MNPERLLQNFDRLIDTPDAVPRLRRFILDLAVRGKLVEQNPEDEPAGELLKRIEAEKKQLVKEGKIKKRSELYNPANGGVPFAIPLKWRWCQFGGIVEFTAGRTPSRHDSSFWNTGDYNWVSIADMADGGLVTNTKETVSNRAKSVIFKSDPSPIGTILMSFKLTIGRVSRLAVPAYHNEAIISIYPYIDKLDPYLFLLLPLFSRAGTKKDAIKGATLNRESLSNIPIPLPPLAEQHRIVAKVDELMKLCDKLETTQAKSERRRDRLVAATLHGMNNGKTDGDNGESLSFEDSARFYFNHLPRLTTRPKHIQKLRETILNLVVRGKLVPQNPKDEPASEVIKSAVRAKQKIFEQWNYRPSKSLSIIDEDDYPFQIPISWRWERIGNFAAVKGGKRLPQGVTFTKHKTPYIYIRVTDMKNQTISMDDPQHIDEQTHNQLARYIIEENDIFVVIVGSTIGKTGTIPRELNGMHLTENAAKLMFRDIDSNFLLIVLRSDFVQEQFIQKTNQVGQPKLALERIESTVVPIPPLSEQHRIVAKVDELMALCDEMEGRITTNTTNSRKLLEATLQEAI